MNRKLKVFIAAAVISTAALSASPWKGDQDDTRTMLDKMRLEISNHETEIKMLEQRINNQSDIADSLQIKQKKDEQSGHLNEDLKKLKDRINLFEDRFAKIEHAIDANNKNIVNIHAALKAIMEALQIKETTSTASSDNIYKVQVGDSLEKIARKHKTTTQALKSENNLASDRIFTGQKLKIPTQS